MRSCPQCGTENGDRAWNCVNCGRQLIASPPPLPADVRKAVTRDRIVGESPADEATPLNTGSPAVSSAGSPGLGRTDSLVAAVAAAVLLAIFVYSLFLSGS